MPDHGLELSFHEQSDQAVRDRWAALQDAGLPSQADHRSMVNAPHLTLVVASPVADEVVERARELVLPLLPATLTVRGLLMLGEGPRVTLAYVVEPDPALAEATASLRAQVPGVRHPVWTPHVTLCRRLPRRRLTEAVAVLEAAGAPATLVADRLRWWDPDQDLIEQLT